MLNNTPIRSDLDAWKILQDHAQETKGLQIKDLFDTDPNRFARFNLKYDGVLLDYSKQAVTTDTIKKLCGLAKSCDLEGWREKLYSGAKINMTEDRAVLHTSLRDPQHAPILVDGEDVNLVITETLERMQHFSNIIRKEKRFTHIINIGIGGSDLGAAMVYEALKPFCDRDFNMHFVSNVDATHLTEALREADPQKTLIIVTSKTFTTQETMTNAYSAKEWLSDKLGTNNLSEHLIAATQNVEAAKEFGVQDDHIFPIWDWVGGRFSLWSAIGLPLCIALGFDHFQSLLDGAHSMDDHFKSADFEHNMPVILAMIGIWNRNFLGYESLCITPYDQYLSRFSAYMQQLDMESNGKSVDRQNRKVPYKTGPIILGDVGTNAQHAFFQSIHQGTTIIPCDFILNARSLNPIGDHQKKLLANAIAQSKALMDGLKTDDPHTSFDGNRPSNTILLDALTPYRLGMLIALYEHKIFVQGIIWNINSFDQCGVELGKDLAKQVVTSLDNLSDDKMDSSTASLINLVKIQ